MHASTSVSGGRHAVFPIENDSIGRLIALLLHRRFFGAAMPNREEPSLRELGWHDSLVSEMHDMPADDVARLLGGPNACVSLVVDPQKVAAGLQSYRAIKRDRSDLEFFLMHGATPALIRMLFPSVSSRTLTSLRRELGCESRGGRPPLPDEATSHAVYRRWQGLCTEESSLRVRYMRLARHFPGVSLATLCAALESR